jgi:hypothetical protein
MALQKGGMMIAGIYVPPAGFFAHRNIGDVWYRKKRDNLHEEALEINAAWNARDEDNTQEPEALHGVDFEGVTEVVFNDAPSPSFTEVIDAILKSREFYSRPNPPAVYFTTLSSEMEYWRLRGPKLSSNQMMRIEHVEMHLDRGDGICNCEGETNHMKPFFVSVVYSDGTAEDYEEDTDKQVQTRVARIARNLLKTQGRVMATITIVKQETT